MNYQVALITLGIAGLGTICGIVLFSYNGMVWIQLTKGVPLVLRRQKNVFHSNREEITSTSSEDDDLN